MPKKNRKLSVDEEVEIDPAMTLRQRPSRPDEMDFSLPVILLSTQSIRQFIAQRPSLFDVPSRMEKIRWRTSSFEPVAC